MRYSRNIFTGIRNHQCHVCDLERAKRAAIAKKVSTSHKGKILEEAHASLPSACIARLFLLRRRKKSLDRANGNLVIAGGEGSVVDLDHVHPH